MNIDACIHFLWVHFLLPSPLFQHDSFEPLLAVTCFAVYIGMWLIIDHYATMLHRYRINKSKDMRSWDNDNRVRDEVMWYIVPLLVFDMFYKRRKLPVQAPTFVRLTIEVLLGLLFYDLFFFLGHFTLHHFPVLYKTIHARHHSMSIIRAGDAIRHTFLDGTFDVVCSIAALNLTHAHPLSRAVYNIIIIYLITEAHCGYDFPWMLHNIIPCHLVAGPVLHDLHHRYGNCNFQKFFTYLDYLNGTLRLSSESSG